MSSVKILQKFQPPKNAFQGFAMVGAEIWLISKTTKKIYGGSLNAARDYKEKNVLASPVGSPGGMAWDGSNLLIADRSDQIIYKMDPESGKTNPILNLADLNYGKAPALFQVRDSQPTDLTWGLGNLWVTCQAGYSSAVFQIDLGNKKVVHHFKTRGPKPNGISFDAGEQFLWIVDSSNLEFSQFSAKGDWTGQIAPSPVKEPLGLVVDTEDTFWTIDQATKQIYQIKRED